ncbi:MAG: hypothetical protein GW902_03100 [Alphaproteobacteria bacterium]|nr:hypothetical protein [Alphaproteobacteria bacterium]
MALDPRQRVRAARLFGNRGPCSRQPKSQFGDHAAHGFISKRLRHQVFMVRGEHSNRFRSIEPIVRDIVTHLLQKTPDGGALI